MGIGETSIICPAASINRGMEILGAAASSRDDSCLSESTSISINFRGGQSILFLVLLFYIEVQHGSVAGEGGNGLDKRHQHWLCFLLADLNKAVPLELLL